MALKILFGMAVAAVGGIYLTSDEGKKAREAIQKKKSTFDPIIKDLLKQVNLLLNDSEKISSEDVKNSVRKLTKEARSTLLSIDLEKTSDTIKEAIKISSKKLREAYNETPKKKIVKKTTKK